MHFSVLKFGGTSVANPSTWPLITTLVKKKHALGKSPVLVLSALAGVSNLLEAIVLKAVNNSHHDELSKIEAIHQRFADNVGIEAGRFYATHWQSLITDCDAIATSGEASPKLHAAVCGVGELLSTSLAYQILIKAGVNAHWLDARDVLKIDETATTGQRKHYLSAICHFDADKSTQNKILASTENQTDVVYVTQGFIASNQQGETILLGRGGSDTSAACLASILGADELEIWTDVPGIYSANPHQVPTARLLTKLDYDEAQEITSSGAKVLHPRAIRPVREYGIPIYIKSVLVPDMAGTCIGENKSDSSVVKAISKRDDLVVITITTSGMWQQSGFLGKVFGIFGSHNISIDLVSTSESNVTVSLDTKANELDQTILNACIDDLSKFSRVKVIKPVASISILGRNIRKVIPKLGLVLESLGGHQIYIISLSSSDLNLTFVVDQKSSDDLMSKMHELLIDTNKNNELFGQSWCEL